MYTPQGYNVFDPSVSPPVLLCFWFFCFVFCQRNSSKQNFVKLCSYEGHSVQVRKFAGNSYLICFPVNCIPFELRNLVKVKYTAAETICHRNSSKLLT